MSADTSVKYYAIAYLRSACVEKFGYLQLKGGAVIESSDGCLSSLALTHAKNREPIVPATTAIGGKKRYRNPLRRAARKVVDLASPE